MTKKSDKPHILLVGGEDWEGIYVGGTLKDEGHSLQAWEVLSIIEDLDLITYREITVSNEFLEEHAGRLPYKWSER